MELGRDAHSVMTPPERRGGLELETNRQGLMNPQLVFLFAGTIRQAAGVPDAFRSGWRQPEAGRI